MKEKEREIQKDRDRQRQRQTQREMNPPVFSGERTLLNEALASTPTLPPSVTETKYYDIYLCAGTQEVETGRSGDQGHPWLGSGRLF